MKRGIFDKASWEVPQDRVKSFCFDLFSALFAEIGIEESLNSKQVGFFTGLWIS